GVTFSDTVQLNTEYPVNSIHLTERKRVAFTGYSGVTQLRFKFELIGNFYYWGIDDIVVYDESVVDLQVDRDWYSVSPYYKMPKTQVSEIPFMSDLSNLGNSDATDVQLNMNITGPSTNQSFDLVYGDFPAASIWDNRPFPMAYKSPANVGTYNAEYFVTSAEDVDGPNNRAGFQWKVTDKTFGNLDNEADFGGNYMEFYAAPWVSVPDSKIYSCGNAYYVPNGTGYVATKARYGLLNPLADVMDQAVRIDLFEWVDADNSGTASANERTRVGTNFQVISDEITNLRNIETDIWASDEDGFAIEGERVKLKDNTHYLIAASVTPNSPDTDPQMQLLGFTPRALDAYNRSIGHILATNFALDSLEALGVLEPRASGSLQAWENTVNTSVEDIDARNFRFIFNGALYTKSYVEMDVDLANNTAEPTLPTVAVKTFPNPAARDLFVDIKLENTSNEVQVTMFDVEGKLVSTRTFNNVQDDRLKLDVSTLTNGVYNVRVVTEEGVATRKVIVQN
ncbi:MAG: T9SS type A sorting domain-containing protein, partial [Saprospiraceae bacterium]